MNEKETINPDRVIPTKTKTIFVGSKDPTRIKLKFNTDKRLIIKKFLIKGDEVKIIQKSEKNYQEIIASVNDLQYYSKI